MKLLIDPSNVSGNKPLHIKIADFSIEISEVSDSGKIVVTDNSGEISVEVLPVVEDVPFIETPIVNNTDETLLKEPEKPLLESISEIQNISPDAVLFRKLVALRRKIAEEANFPPYIIFHDTTLKDMVLKMPVDLDEMQDVSGVGQTKLQKYGIRFVNVIKEHLADSA